MYEILLQFGSGLPLFGLTMTLLLFSENGDRVIRDIISFRVFAYGQVFFYCGDVEHRAYITDDGFLCLGGGNEYERWTLDDSYYY